MNGKTGRNVATEIMWMVEIIFSWCIQLIGWQITWAGIVMQSKERVDVIAELSFLDLIICFLRRTRAEWRRGKTADKATDWSKSIANTT